MIVCDLDLLSIPAAAFVQSNQLERRTKETVNRIQILNVEVVDPLAKNLGFVIGLDP
jgi:hypothetical protein